MQIVLLLSVIITKTKYIIHPLQLLYIYVYLSIIVHNNLTSINVY